MAVPNAPKIRVGLVALVSNGSDYLVAAILTFLLLDVPLMESGRLPKLAHLLGTHYLTI